MATIGYEDLLAGYGFGGVLVGLDEVDASKGYKKAMRKTSDVAVVLTHVGSAVANIADRSQRTARYTEPLFTTTASHVPRVLAGLAKEAAGVETLTQGIKRKVIVVKNQGGSKTHNTRDSSSAGTNDDGTYF